MKNIKQLFIITCIAKALSEEGGYGDTRPENQMERAAYLFFLAKGFGPNDAEIKGEKAYKEINKIWLQNGGNWPANYRFEYKIIATNKKKDKI